MGQGRIARTGPPCRAATRIAGFVRPLRPQRPLLEHDGPAARKLPQFRPAGRPLCQSADTLQRGEHDAPLRNQIHPLGVHRPQRRTLHLRKGRHAVRSLHDRRVPRHLGTRVGELPAAAAERHGTVGGDLRAAGGRHQAVDLPLAGRRLAHPAHGGPRSARRRRDGGGATQRELPQSARCGGVQQPDRRGRRRRGQREAERRTARCGRIGPSVRGGQGGADGHAGRCLRRPYADRRAPERPPGLCAHRPVRRSAARGGVHPGAAGPRFPPQRHPDPRALEQRRGPGGRDAAGVQAHERRSPLPLRRDDAGGASRGARSGVRLRGGGLAAGRQARRPDVGSGLQRLSGAPLRHAAAGGGALFLPRDPPAGARGGVRTDRDAAPAARTPVRERLSPSHPRGDHPLQRPQDSRHPALPAPGGTRRAAGSR